MGWEHFTGKPVQQGTEKMGCWAACMSWWLSKVRKWNYSMEAIASLYKSYTAAPAAGCTIGGLSDAGVKRMFEDYRWSIWHTWEHREKIGIGTLDMYLDASPTFISYYDKALKGAHMNVIVARSDGDDPNLYVMDPDYPDYQIRKLRYYTINSEQIVLASAIKWN